MTKTPPLSRPSKDDVAQMPFFEGLPPSRIHVVKSTTQIEFALRALAEAGFIGFDIETKPVFTAGEISDGMSYNSLRSGTHSLFKLVLQRPLTFSRSFLSLLRS